MEPTRWISKKSKNKQKMEEDEEDTLQISYRRGQAQPQSASLPAHVLRFLKHSEGRCQTAAAHRANAGAGAAGRCIFESHPFVFFGHSFGAWLAYEMVQESRRRKKPPGEGGRGGRGGGGQQRRVLRVAKEQEMTPPQS